LGMSCFFCSCLHESFELCSPFLVCCVGRFRDGRGFVPLGRMVVVSICLCWNVLLGFLLRWHREFLFGWNTVGANVGGVTRKIWMIPLTREREFLARSSTKLEHGVTVIPSADCTSSQKSESVYTCPCAPFYREMKGLLHTKNTLWPREYS
jgi:hypothetical protein